MPSKRYKDWEDDALMQLQIMDNIPLNLQYFHINYTFYTTNRRHYDLDNAIASVNDLLEKAGIIMGDDNQHLISFTCQQEWRDTAGVKIVIYPRKKLI